MWGIAKLKELLIHTGFAKCASSSIQSFLTLNPKFEIDGKTFRFLGFNQSDDLVDTQRIEQRGHYPPYFFQTNFSNDNFRLSKQLRSIKRCKADVGIISSEALSSWLTPDRAVLLSALDIPIHLFVVVRPFSDWLNSAWWQWGAFTGHEVDRWVSSIDIGAFPMSLSSWLSLPQISKCTLVDLNDSPVEKLADVLGLKTAQSKKVNTGSSEELLRFLIKNKEVLGRAVHKPQIEFILNDELDFSGPKPKSIITSEKATSILSSYSGIDYGHSRDLLMPIFERHKRDLELNMQRFEESESVASLKSFLAKDHCPVFLQAMCDLLVKRSTLPATFSATKYLYMHKGVANAGIDPYEHYTKYGRAEGRSV